MKKQLTYSKEALTKAEQALRQESKRSHEQLKDMTPSEITQIPDCIQLHHPNPPYTAAVNYIIEVEAASLVNLTPPQNSNEKGTSKKHP